MAAVTYENFASSGWSSNTLPVNSFSGNWESNHGIPEWKAVTSPGLAGANGAVFPDGNHRPSLYCSPAPAVGKRMQGKLKVTVGDNDFIGWSVGFNPGSNDWEDDSAFWYLIDWKKGNQDLNGNWNKCGGGKKLAGDRGISVSEISGQPRESELWSHTNQSCSTGEVSEIQTGVNFGDKTKTSSEWVKNREYNWCLEVSEDSFKLSIDGKKEIHVTSASVDANSPICFYSFSQDESRFYDVVTSSLTEKPPVAGCDRSEIGDSSSKGDPHFNTWKQEHFEFHGQCDMILAKDSQFANGVGLDVQIRTKMVRYWSYIHTAAIRIGDDILEIQGSPDNEDRESHYWFNFQYQADATSIGGFPLSIKSNGAHKRFFEIDLSSKFPGQKIILSAFKEFVSVDFKGGSAESFGNTVGLLGDFNSGKTLARDGAKEIHDFNELGNEWQVLPSDDMLFHDKAEPQFPKRCILPEDPQGERRRRLDESSISIEQAEAACATLKDPQTIKDCVYDILATQDLDMVGAF